VRRAASRRGNQSTRADIAKRVAFCTGEDAARGEDLYVHASPADQALIAAARNALPALLDEIERLRAARVAAE